MSKLSIGTVHFAADSWSVAHRFYWRLETPTAVQSNPQPWKNTDRNPLFSKWKISPICAYSTHVSSLTRPHTRAHGVRETETAGSEDYESVLSSNLHGNVMSALPFDHGKCVTTKGLTPALLKIRIGFYHYYQLQSAARKQMLHTGVLMWMAVGISRTKAFVLCDSRREERHRKVLERLSSHSLCLLCRVKPEAGLWSCACSIWMLDVNVRRMLILY